VIRATAIGPVRGCRAYRAALWQTRGLRCAYAAAACLLFLSTPIAFADGEPKPTAGAIELLQSDSRSPYVHRLTLYDEHGTAINPKAERPAPYSPRATCGKCHPYGEISRGWHFNAPDPNVSPGRPGEPWFLIDTREGVVLPVSGRAWPGTFRPEQLGLSDWQLVLRFGRHLPGGGFGEPDPARRAQAKEKLRWAVSGPLEIDCMFCHSADHQHDPAEAARQIEAQNFRWAPTVALGLAVIRGEARKVPDDWDPTLPPNPDYPEQAGPRLIYDRTRFDADDRVLFNITRRPANERCYFCHSFREVGPHATDDLLVAQDVHLAAGLLCVDCHRNEIDHRIIRGYPGEAAERKEPALAAFTCEGCHLGTPDADDLSVALGGRYRAPHPQHPGLPPLHFDKLTCTACHSGPWPQLDAKHFQTAMAHGLGLPTRDRKDDQPPLIVGPVFVRQADGRVGPHRLAWVGRVAAGASVDGKPAHVAHSQQVSHVCWPLAHDVRPAAQSLGVRGCADCHAEDAPLDFGRVSPPVTPVAQAPPGSEGATMTMVELRGDDVLIRRLWARAFLFRPAFKWFGLACAGLVLLVLLRFLLDAITHSPPPTDTGSASPVAARRTGLSAGEHIFHGLAVLGVIIQAGTGLGSKLFGLDLAGWRLLIHMGGAFLFLVGLTVTTLQWAGRCRPVRLAGKEALTAGQRWVFFVYVAAGWLVMVTMLGAMLPVAGYREQDLLKETHENAALVLLAALAVHTIVSWAARRARRRKP